MSQRRKRALGPASAFAVALTATLGCDDPLPCQFTGDMAAPGADMRADDMSQPPADMAQVSTFACRCTDQFGVPLAGVAVSLGGRSAVTGADGSFTLLDVPVAARVITLDGSAVVPPEIEIVRAEASLRVAGKEASGVAAPGQRRYARIAEEVTLQPGVSSVREHPFVVPLSAPMEEFGELLDENDVTTAEVAVTGDRDDYDPAVAEARLIIAKGTKIVFPAGTPKALSLTRVPPAMKPGTLPAGSASPLVVMIQPQGTTFTPPAELILPTHYDAPVGQKQDLLQLDPDTGRYASMGVGTVYEGDSYFEIKPDAGVRVGRAGFHLALCPTVSVQGVVRRGETPVVGARVEARTIDSLEVSYNQVFPVPGATALTGADGRYMLSGLAACQLHLLGTSQSPQGLLAVSSNAYLVNEGKALTQDLSLPAETQRRFNLRVRVRNPDDMDKPFRGVSVYSIECKAGDCYGETNALGEVLFRDMLGTPGQNVEVEICGNRGGTITRQVAVPAQTPNPPACGLFQAADVQELNISTNCGSGSF